MDAIENLLTRGVDKIYPAKEALEKVLREGKKLKLYQGFDPSMPSLHLGNLVGLIKLSQFQKMGHHVIFLVGDFTGMIGDPTDKLATRKKLTREQVLENAKNWKEQAQKILNFDGNNPAKIMFNSAWLDKVNFKELIEITSNLTYQQLIERDMFQERIKNNQPIHFHELLYPIAQGYDSVAMNVDMEIGGRDQIFNMLVGRTLVSAINHKEKFVLGTKLLVDKEGNKVGKTTGNALFLDSESQDFYSGIMSFPDEVIELGFELLTDTDFASLKHNIKNHPMNEKKHLAFEIVKKLWGEENAVKAQDYFSKTFQQHNLSDVKEFEMNQLSSNPITIVNLLVNTQSAASKSEAKRLIEQKAVEIDQTVVDMIQTNITLKTGMTLRVGKKRFLKFR